MSFVRQLLSLSLFAATIILLSTGMSYLMYYHWIEGQLIPAAVVVALSGGGLTFMWTLRGRLDAKFPGEHAWKNDVVAGVVCCLFFVCAAIMFVMGLKHGLIA